MTDEDIANSSPEVEESLNPNKPISDAEVEQCKAEILKLHPLSRLPLKEILPSCAWFINCCCGCFVSNEEKRIEEEKKALAEENAAQN